MTQFCQISPSVSREPDDQANNEDEDEDNGAFGDGTADHEVVPAHVGRPLRLHILLHFLRLESLVAGGRREAGASCRQSAACHTLGRLPTNIGIRVPAAAAWWWCDNSSWAKNILMVNIVLIWVRLVLQFLPLDGQMYLWRMIWEFLFLSIVFAEFMII